MRPWIARYDGNAEWYDETFSAFRHEDEEAWLRECLGPGGRFAYLGVHPCYVGPFVYRLPWDLALPYPGTMDNAGAQGVRRLARERERRQIPRASR